VWAGDVEKAGADETSLARSDGSHSDQILGIQRSNHAEFLGSLDDRFWRGSDGDLAFEARSVGIPSSNLGAEFVDVLLPFDQLAVHERDTEECNRHHGRSQAEQGPLAPATTDGLLVHDPELGFGLLD
jgi:hypothetical protein